MGAGNVSRGGGDDDLVTCELHREMTVSLGPVPSALDTAAVSEDGLSILRDEFLFVTPGGVRYHYRKGDGIVGELPDPSFRDEFEIYLWGTVFGAVAWLNGMFPLHASAIVLDGRVMAFTADSGGGKSTLATALSARGFEHVCDDTLPLASLRSRVMAIPDRKPVKLWSDALALTGATAEREITMIPGKHFTRPLRVARSAFPLSDLFLLEAGPAVAVERMHGAEVLTLLTEAMYRPQIPVALGDRSAHGGWLMRLARDIRFWRLRRPWQPDDAAAFARSVDDIAAALRNLPGPAA